MYFIRLGDGADFLGHRLHDALAESLRVFDRAARNDVGVYSLSFDVVRVPHHGAFHHAWGFVDGVSHLRRADAVAADIDHIVHSPDDAVIAIGIAAGAVAREVFVFEGRKIRLAAAFMVVIGGSDDAGPRVFDTKHTLHVVAFDFVAAGVHQTGLYPRQRQGGKTRLQGGNAGDGRDHHPTRLGLPPSVDDWAFFLADFFIVPMPSFFVDGFAHRAEYAQRRHAPVFYPFVAGGHQGADGRGGRIKDVDLVFLDDLPETPQLNISSALWKKNSIRTNEIERSLKTIKALSNFPH